MRRVRGSFTESTGNLCGGYREPLRRVPVTFAEESGDLCGGYLEPLQRVPRIFAYDFLCGDSDPRVDFFVRSNGSAHFEFCDNVVPLIIIGHLLSVIKHYS